MSEPKFDPESKIVAAKFAAERDMPFLGRILYSMDIQEVTEDSPLNNQPNHTACVDNRGRMWWWKDFIDGLSVKEMGGLFAHEVFHIADEHIRRSQGRIAHLITLAGELKADWFVVASGLTLPASFEEHGVYVKHGTGYLNLGEDGGTVTVPNVDEMALEQIYAFLLKLQEEGSDEQKKKKREALKKLADAVKDCLNAGGSPGESEGGGEEEDEVLKGLPGGIDPEDMIEIVRAAKEEAARRGTGSGALDTWLKSSPKSFTNWKRLLAEAFSPLYRGHRTFKKIHKRSQAMKFALPGYKRDGARLVIHIDTSGSVLSYLNMFYSEIKSIISSWRKVSVDIVLCDYGPIEDKDIISVKSTRDLPENLKITDMGGGTSHKPVVEWIMENARDSRVVISLTDGFSDIEHCFDKLPSTMKRILAIPMSCYNKEDSLAPYCERIIILPEKET